MLILYKNDRNVKICVIYENPDCLFSSWNRFSWWRRRKLGWLKIWTIKVDINFQWLRYVRHIFLTCFWHVFLSDWTFFGQEIFSLDKFWFREWAQNIFKPLVWHLLHQNILIINDFMKVYEKLIIFIKPKFVFDVLT